MSDDIKVIDLRGMLGNNVICDLCGTHVPEGVSGGGIFSATGACPDCWEGLWADYDRYPDEQRLFYSCPSFMSHNDFVRLFREDQVKASIMGATVSMDRKFKEKNGG